MLHSIIVMVMMVVMICDGSESRASFGGVIRGDYHVSVRPKSTKNPVLTGSRETKKLKGGGEGFAPPKA